LLTVSWCTLNLFICLLRYLDPSKEAITFIGFPGELFMNMLKAIILPLIASSLVSGLSQLDIRTSGKVGRLAISYYMITTVLAVVLGIILVTMLHPGDPKQYKRETMDNDVMVKVSTTDKLFDLLRNMLPENIVRSTFQQQQTVYITVNSSDGHISEESKIKYTDGMNVLGVIIFCITMGIVISRVGDPARPLVDFFMALDVVITRMVFIIMWFGIIGIPSLIAHKILEVNDFMATARTLLMFIVTVNIAGLAVQCFITLPLIYFVTTRQNPYRFLRGLGQAVLTALGTASSAATLPVTFRCLHEIGIDSRVTKFVLPVGAVINMDGTALYEATASVFIAQMNGMELTFGQILTVSITATLASIGAASIPGAGLVTMTIVLTALGLPVNDISLVVAVDWLMLVFDFCFIAKILHYFFLYSSK
uniref:Amino acid transporter n=1 Tax=Angiostrongylus cantonensis TaxID=6313 RepID=A0A0K0CWY2_ANGCA